MSEYYDPSELTREKLQELRKLQMQAMIAVLEQTHPREVWNLLVRDYPNHTKVREFLSYNSAREAQETVIKKDRPAWTAIVRDRRK